MRQNENAYFLFLDDVGKSGLIRMYTAAPLLREAFPELSYRGALDVLQNWMGSFPRQNDLETAAR